MEEQRITAEMLKQAISHIFESKTLGELKAVGDMINLIVTAEGYTCFDVSTKKTKMVVGISAFKNLIEQDIIDVQSSEIQLNGAIVEGEDKENVLKYISSL